MDGCGEDGATSTCNRRMASENAMRSCEAMLQFGTAIERMHTQQELGIPQVHDVNPRINHRLT